MDFLTDMWKFLKARKKWWLFPIILLMLLVGIFIVLGGASAVAPFIYSLFQFIPMNKEKKLESVVIIAAGFIILFLVFKIKWFLLTALLVSILSVMSNFVLDKITWLWFKIAEILGWINSCILLGIIFFIFLSPLAFVMRLMNKGSIKFNKQEGSYYHERDHTYVNEDLENTW